VPLQSNQKSAHKTSAGRTMENTPSFAVIRVDRQAGRWEAVPLALIEDARLSLEARWFATWLASRPPGWEIRAGALPHLLRDHTRRTRHVGRDTTKRLLRELQQCGYLLRTRLRTSSGRWVWRSVFSAVQSRLTIDWRTVDGNSGDINHTDQFIRSGTTTTFTTGPRNSAAVPVGSRENRFPDCFDGKSLEAARALIATCPTHQRQAVLDEIGAMHARQRVRSPIGLLHRLIERASAGRFVRNLSAQRAPRSRTSPDDRKRHEVNRSEYTSAVQASGIAERTLAKLRQSLK